VDGRLGHKSTMLVVGTPRATAGVGLAAAVETVAAALVVAGAGGAGLVLVAVGVGVGIGGRMRDIHVLIASGKATARRAVALGAGILGAATLEGDTPLVAADLVVTRAGSTGGLTFLVGGGSAGHGGSGQDGDDSKGVHFDVCFVI